MAFDNKIMPTNQGFLAIDFVSPAPSCIYWFDSERMGTNFDTFQCMNRFSQRNYYQKPKSHLKTI